MIKLRPYQNDVVDRSRDLMRRGCSKILIESPVGSGKTVLASFMLQSASDKGITCWFIVHRRELLKQSIKTLYQFGVECGVIAAGFQESPNFKVQVCSIDTLRRRLDKYPAPGLMIFDEGHHCASKSWQTVYNHFPKAYKILLTATPCRLDGKGLSDYADEIVHGPKISWLIENKFLCNYEMYAPNQVSMAGVKTRMGDYAIKDMAELVDRPTITGSAINEYNKRCPGKRAVVFCITIEHSHNVVREFNNAGIVAVHVDGETKKEIRDQVLKDFVSGEIKILSNVGLFSEGIDIPALEALIMLRPTQSLSLYIQQCGRVLRPAPRKTAIILDHVGNYERHGLVCQDREWKLSGRKKRKKGDDGPPVKMCKACFAVQHISNLVCKYCGEKFPLADNEITSVEGELEKIDKEKARLVRKKEQGNARTFEELTALGRSRNYKSPERWAEHLLNSRKSYGGKG